MNFKNFEEFNQNIKINNKLNNHKQIKEKLILLKETNNIPNIIFHGENKSGKKIILNFFINLIYNNNQQEINNHVLTINCSLNKGIKYIREDLKFFCKTIVNFDNGKFFKSIILLNGDKLTIDAQSALRRCIEIYSHNTRFFIVVENMNHLLKPIISRFASIFIINYNFNSKNLQNENKLNLIFQKNKDNIDLIKINKLTNYLYNSGYSALDIFNFFKNQKKTKNIDEEIIKYKILVNFINIKKEIRSEKLLIFYLLKNLFIRYNNNL